MAPKKSSGPGTKKRKTSGSARGSRSYDALRFLGPDQQARFAELQGRTVWPERRFFLNPQGANRAVQDILVSRKWNKLLEPPLKLNYEVVREFYANAIPIGQEPYNFTTVVRGRQIHFDRDTLNRFLGEPSNLDSDQLCEYSEMLVRQNWPVEDMVRDIFIEGESFQLNNQREERRAIKETLTIPAQIIHLLICYNLKPRSHVHTAPMDRATLIWYILTGREVDIARVIANEMRSVAESGIKNDAKPVLPYPGLIIGLCEAEHVHIPAIVSHTTDKLINDKYIKRYCKLKEVQQQPQQQPQAPQLPAAPLHPVEPQQAYPNIDPRLQNWFYHTWDQNTSNHRALTVLQESMYRMQLDQGVPVNHDYQVMDPQHFQTHIAWPGDRPQFTGGAETSNVGGDNDDSIDEAAADAMDDGDDATQTMEGDNDLVDFDG
ncbi:hypothetical protein TSUD_416440 [Trifolium subterraneum]|uniref:Putative plant transposon protein domain-containing protein n=1 Tax=Trifolium subterraneum TaxID=3900 RepID=A0A2Z6PJQ0_TRISU|nr:hypothetical protein TSUD_416440 [Trifolium subterraneum]